MTTYIALLRGINVGGKNMIKMAELRKAFENLGFSRVQTYIQSGNVLFESEETEDALSRLIENEIKKVFGLEVSIILRTARELKQILENLPFSEEAISAAEAASDAESLYVAILAEVPSKEGIDRVQAYKSDGEEYRIIGREVYLLFNNSIRNSKLANNLHKLGVTATVRNWKTLSKLAELTKILTET